MSPRQLRVLAEKLDGWTCDDQLSLLDVEEPQGELMSLT